MTSWLVGTRKGLFVVGKDEAGWTVQRTAFLGEPVTQVLADPRDGRWYVALEHGHFGPKLHASDDQGRTWQPIATPAFAELPDGDGPSVTAIWSLEAAGERALWCGTVSGGLFRSDDRGASWQLNEALWQVPGRDQWFGAGNAIPVIHTILVDPRDSRWLRVAISSGGVWESRDDGASWQIRAKGMKARYMPPERVDDQASQDPHRIAQCAAAPDVLWCQHHCGIWRSVDGGAQWEEVHAEPSSFGFGVVVHPHDPDTAWFVPAEVDARRVPVRGEVVVTRTRDGGRTFDVLRDGLPQTHAYDLTLRHALDIDASGRCLAFGSTTGSLWITEDGGEAWRHVSGHLPPIYVVRAVG